MKLSRTFALLLLPLAQIMLTACGKPAPPIPPSLELPKPVSDLHAYRKGDKVTLTWTVPNRTTEGQTIRHLGVTRICRSLESNPRQCPQIGQATPAQLGPASVARIKKTKQPQRKPKQKEKIKPEERVQATYVDVLPSDIQNQHPTELGTYSVETLNEDGRSAGLSNPSQVPLAPTLPSPSDLRAQSSADGVILSWVGKLPECQTTGLTYVYRVYRREQGAGTDSVAGEVPMADSPQASFTDHSFEWNKSYEYRVVIVTMIGGPQPSQVESEDPPSVAVTATDVFPPAVPSGIQAVFSGVGQQPFIDLTWIPATEADLAGYNIYRHEEGQQPAKINPQPASSPAFRDSNVTSGKKYFYSVSSVDVRGNESARSEEASETVP